MGQQQSKGRYHHLDSLRGFAALMVCLRHVNWTNHLTSNGFIENSGLFVDFFFVLSGIVISLVYSDLGTFAKLGTFARRRIARLYPLHLLSLLIVALAFSTIYLAFPHTWVKFAHMDQMQDLPRKFVLNLLLLNAHSLAAGDSFNVPSWSIGAEFTCYIAYGAIAYFLPKYRNLIFAAAAAASFAFLIQFHHELLAFRSYYGFVRGILGFSLGGLVYAAAMRRKAATTSSAALTIALAATCAVLIAVVDQYGFWLSFAMPFLFAALLFTLMTPDPRIRNFLVLRPFLLLGTLSYSIYMIHFLVRWLIGVVGMVVFHARYKSAVLLFQPLFGDGAVILYVAIVLGLAWLSYNYVETPIREYFHDRRLFTFRRKDVIAENTETP